LLLGCNALDDRDFQEKKPEGVNRRAYTPATVSKTPKCEISIDKNPGSDIFAKFNYFSNGVTPLEFRIGGNYGLYRDRKSQAILRILGSIGRHFPNPENEHGHQF
jgi:hypothetical protein